MASYDLRVKPSVARDVRGIPEADLRRLLERIEALRDEPRPRGCEKPSASPQYRVRQGSYRTLYTIADDPPTVEIVKIAHRREAYSRP